MRYNTAVLPPKWCGSASPTVEAAVDWKAGEGARATAQRVCRREFA